MPRSVSWIPSPERLELGAWSRPALPLLVVSALLCLGVANIVGRATWRTVEDGVLWKSAAPGLVAEELADPSPAVDAGLRSGDLLLAVDDLPVETASELESTLRAAATGGR